MYLVQGNERRFDSKELYSKIDEYLQPDLIIDGYKEYEESIPNNPTTLKPRTYDCEGFINFNNNQKIYIEYKKAEHNKYLLIKS